jgi:hypothetical protein
MFSPHRNHDIHFYFSKLVVQQHEMKKNVISRYNAHKKFIMTHKNYNRIIEMFIEYIYTGCLQ